VPVLVDPPGERPQRIRVRPRGELVGLFSRLREQTDFDFLSAEVEGLEAVRKRPGTGRLKEISDLRDPIRRATLKTGLL